MEATGQVLEITLISAQGLKEDSAKARRLQAYALTWVDPQTKLRTRVDRIGGPNPTWNDRFLFKVRPDFLASETSGVSIEIYSVGVLRDKIIGSVRFLISNLLPVSARSSVVAPMKTPCFTALQIRRPSGSFYGVLNIAAMVLDSSNIPALKGYGVSSICHRDLVGDGIHDLQRRRGTMMTKSMSMPVRYNNDGGSSENSLADSWDGSDGGESTTSSSSATSTALKEWNGVARVLAGKNHVRAPSEGGRILCGLPMHRKMFL